MNEPATLVNIMNHDRLSQGLLMLVVNWSNGRSSRFPIEKSLSSRGGLDGGLSQVSVYGPVLLLIYMIDLTSGKIHPWHKLVEDVRIIEPMDAGPLKRDQGEV